MPLLISLLAFVVTFGALADIITIDMAKMKHLPKVVWILVVILLPVMGALLWFAVGRQYPGPGSAPRVRRTAATRRPVSGPRDSGIMIGPRDTAAELAALEREIAADERLERIRELEAQLEAKRRRKGLSD